MIQKKISDFILEKCSTDNNRELIHYGLEILKAKSILIGFMLIFAIEFNIVVEALLFYMFFTPLRERIGGYHMENQLLCYLFSIIISIFFPLLAVKLQIGSVFIVILFILFSIIILSFAPIETKNKILDKVDKQYLHRQIKKNILILTSILIFAFTVNWLILINILILACCLNAVLLFIGFLKNKSTNSNKRSKKEGPLSNR